MLDVPENGKVDATTFVKCGECGRSYSIEAMISDGRMEGHVVLSSKCRGVRTNSTEFGVDNDDVENVLLE